jgi:hypothetical protein
LLAGPFRCFPPLRQVENEGHTTWERAPKNDTR